MSDDNGYSLSWTTDWGRRCYQTVEIDGDGLLISGQDLGGGMEEYEFARRLDWVAVRRLRGLLGMDEQLPERELADGVIAAIVEQWPAEPSGVADFSTFLSDNDLGEFWSRWDY